MQYIEVDAVCSHRNGNDFNINAAQHVDDKEERWVFHYDHITGLSQCAGDYIRSGYMSPKRPSPEPGDFLPLTPAIAHILLALADGEKHGYAIMGAAEELSDGLVRLGPGTLQPG